ncbi:hypothetical protein TM5383_00335 [Thalassovita mediterranea]|jgi:hypothetical protein|uniref:Uncharacterized protein n=2 Tax=Thalassovita mediterranea TaxID=340021 RepID=A0A0P1GLX2_9RHOB|nr:hypothetical protein TM5383_00335 [Thalassovita mediterranea]SIS33345.1 hypothetical protein SAMN05421685_10863 [Thalassovita mediterranea]
MSDIINYSGNTHELPPRPKFIGWYEETIPIRGCRLDLDGIKELYIELSSINRKFGAGEIAGLVRDPEMSDAEWNGYQEYLLEDAFCLAILIKGENDQQVYGESSEVFESEALPNPIKAIYFDNVKAWRRHAPNVDPQNRIEVYLDFGKPPLLDPTSVLSEPTPNASNVSVRADDMTYFRAVQKVVDDKLLSHRTWYSAIHGSFAYDVGIWLVALPAGLVIATFYMESLLPVGSRLEVYRWAFFIYALGLTVLGYRFVTGYAKWAFPVNVLADNKDRSVRHRVALGGIFAALGYKAFDAVYSLLPF